MGSPANEANRRDNEGQQKVTFARPFAVGRTEITWDQWEACVRDRACDGMAIEAALRTKETGEPNPDFVDWGRGTRPVVGVNWFDAQSYVGWLNRKTGADDAYRLLSDAEWEYAARAGTTSAYPWGEKIDHNYGNFGIEGPGLGGKADGRDTWLAQTAPVASFPANAFGVYDMHGNIFEWVEDCYEADRAHAPRRTAPRTSKAIARTAYSAPGCSSATRTCIAPPSGGALSLDAARAQLSRIPRRQDAGVILRGRVSLTRRVEPASRGRRAARSGL